MDTTRSTNAIFLQKLSHNPWVLGINGLHAGHTPWIGGHVRHQSRTKIAFYSIFHKVDLSGRELLFDLVKVLIPTRQQRPQLTQMNQ